jgi:3-hydroxy-D-aspartate aldolase
MTPIAARKLDRGGSPTKAFEPSLFVWATVMSRPTEDRAIVDAGLKALAFASGPPLVCDEPAATYEGAFDGHDPLAVSGATNRLWFGDKIRLVPGYCDPTVNLYDWYVAIPGNFVEQLWPITACGMVDQKDRVATPEGRSPLIIPTSDDPQMW